MSQALYRKYRSTSLADVVGQDHITDILHRSLKAGRIAHAYLFTGPRGVGKTSIARILAHEINQLPYTDESHHLDIIEIDAASNNGVEDVRDLRDKVHIAPSSAAKKVYIIDEVHMLSKQAFNALLKTLEEPPEHVVFILATTDADKLPATIISRVQRFNFRAIGTDDVVKHLAHIAEQESISISNDALELIARHGGGSFRDSIGLLDQLQHASDERIERTDVEQALGVTTDDTLSQLIEAYRTGDITSLAREIQLLENSGTQAAIVTHQLIAELQQTIVTHPEDINVLDSLLDVASSAYPYVKLLSVLAVNTPRVTNTPQQTPAPVAETTPKETKKAAAPTKQKMSDAQNDVAPPRSSDKKQSPTVEQPQSRIPTQAASDFDWNKLLEQLKDEVAVRSLLTKSSHKLEDATLTIFAGNKFNAARLNGPKQLPKLHEALEKLGFGSLTIDIKADTAPPSDSQLASVAAIMGGGTEVELDQNA